jgi:hypothetical protein
MWGMAALIVAHLGPHDAYPMGGRRLSIGTDGGQGGSETAVPAAVTAARVPAPAGGDGIMGGNRW